MSTDPLLSVFPPDLLRLILCGGGGLPAAWGPIAATDAAQIAWHPGTGSAFDSGPWQEVLPLTEPDQWRLPLDHWRSRLALVAAWMLGIEARAADVYGDTDGFVLVVWTGATTRDVIRLRAWDAVTGSSANAPDLPTLPAHLQTHDPAVALLLAVWEAIRCDA